MDVSEQNIGTSTTQCQGSNSAPVARTTAADKAKETVTIAAVTAIATVPLGIHQAVQAVPVPRSTQIAPIAPIAKTATQPITTAIGQHISLGTVSSVPRPSSFPVTTDISVQSQPHHPPQLPLDQLPAALIYPSSFMVLEAPDLGAAKVKSLLQGPMLKALLSKASFNSALLHLSPQHHAPRPCNPTASDSSALLCPSLRSALVDAVSNNITAKQAYKLYVACTNCVTHIKQQRTAPAPLSSVLSRVQSATNSVCQMAAQLSPIISQRKVADIFHRVRGARTTKPDPKSAPAAAMVSRCRLNPQESSTAPATAVTAATNAVATAAPAALISVEMVQSFHRQYSKAIKAKSVSATASYESLSESHGADTVAHNRLSERLQPLSAELSPLHGVSMEASLHKQTKLRLANVNAAAIATATAKAMVTATRKAAIKSVAASKTDATSSLLHTLSEQDQSAKCAKTTKGKALSSLAQCKAHGRPSLQSQLSRGQKQQSLLANAAIAPSPDLTAASKSLYGVVAVVKRAETTISQLSAVTVYERKGGLHG